ncbi:MAG TPA: PEP-CTERM sorting domain-containing protein, partial [Caulobacteraceae bacterium]
LEASGEAENKVLLSTTNGIVSIGVFIEVPVDDDPPFPPVPVEIQGSYELQASDLGQANVRVGDNIVSMGRFAGSSLFNAACGLGAPDECSGGTFDETAFFSPGTVYSFTLSAGGFVGSDTDDLKGGSYLASIDPKIFIDNSSGDFNGFRLDIGTIADSPSAAPEPASWALLLGGCGVLGATLRRHNRRTLTSSYLAS